MSDDNNHLITERREKLQALRALAAKNGSAVFPNDFKPKHHAADLHHKYGQVPNEELEPQHIAVVVAGRLMLKRVMGKACFGTLQDGSFGENTAASSSTSRKTPWVPKRWTPSNMATSVTSSDARACCSAPRPANCRSRQRKCGC